ncbi:MAG: hypothetical protein E7539_07655 [Ruminococcaceae bacterium]|nr:hypothetical protein [Oscillospiraceae bacterium]
MAEIKEIRDAMRKKKRNRNIRRISILIILLALVVMVIVNRDRLTPEAISQWLEGSISAGGEGEGFPVNLPSGETVSLLSAGSNIALTNQTNVYFYSPRGKRLRNVQHSCKNVQSKAAGNNLLVYSVGANTVRVETNTKTAVSMTTDNPITTGAISKNGRFALSTESDVYTSEMKVYDKNGNAVFKWTPSGAVITSLALSDDGHYVAAATVYTKGGKIMSGIYLFTTGKSEALLSYNIEDEIVRSLYCDKNSVRVITDSRAFCVDKKGELKGNISFEEKKLIGIDETQNGNLLVFRDVNDPSKSVLTVINQNAEVTAEASVPHAVKAVACGGDDVFMITDELLLCYEASTAIKTGESAIEHDAESLCATSAGAFVITSASELIAPEVK